MRTQQKLVTIEQRARPVGKRLAPPEGAYPTDIVDLIIFHKLHLNLPLSRALKSFRNLKTAFVDWNEVRVSSVREIHEALCRSSASLPLAVFIKELLEFIHREQQVVSLEFLVEQNLTDIRRYLRQVRGVDPSTVNIVLHVRKEHPVLPLSRSMEVVLDRVGVLRSKDNRDKKERALHELVGADRTLAVHHFLLNHSQERCPPDTEQLDCPRCSMRAICAFYANGAKASSRRRTASSSARQNGTGQAARKTVAARKTGGSRRRSSDPARAATRKRTCASASGKNSTSRRGAPGGSARAKGGPARGESRRKRVAETSGASPSRTGGSGSAKRSRQRRPRLGK